MSRELLYEDDGGRQSMYRHRGVRFAECAMVETMGYQGGWMVRSTELVRHDRSIRTKCGSICAIHRR